jgi:ribosomal protein S3AE
LWLTAIKALGRLANRDDRLLLVAIATENKLERYQHPFLEKMPLAQRFPVVKQRNHIRQRAIAVLANIGDQDTVVALLEAGIDGELSRVIYQAASDIFTRVG